MGLFSRDLVLLHPPAVYDFRKRRSLLGPISDVIPSSPVFEMYPLGLTTIANHLEREGFNVEIVNVAYRMLSDPDYDAETELARLNPGVFGIDLHWLPHAHGALELARIVKENHPETPVVFGGLSASYYHEELITYPWVDMVLRGDSTEAPMLELVRAIRFGGSLEEIPNLTWKTPDGRAVVNPLSHVPDSLDDISIPNYQYVMRAVLKYGSLANVIPYVDWLDYPITALLTARGCSLNCSICGGSRFAYREICNRSSPAFRSPEALVEDVSRIRQFSQAPIFFVHDIRQGGRAYWRRLLELLEREEVENELIFELFGPADESFFSQLDRATRRFSLEMTLETHREDLRKLNGKFACSNEKVERTIEAALDLGVNRIDLFFMVGVPRQTYMDAIESVDYCRQLLERFPGERRLAFFVAPLAPFVDPGSLAFEFPDRYGYRLLCRTLEEHRRALTAPSWKYILNYETETLSRDDIVDATYETALRLARLKRDYGLMDPASCAELCAGIETSRLAIAEIDRLIQRGASSGELDEQRARELEMLLASPPGPNAIVKRELRWPIRRRFATGFRLLRLLVALLFTEIYLFVFKRLKLALTPRRRRSRDSPGDGPR